MKTVSSPSGHSRSVIEAMSAAMETSYANVHRGSGHHSTVTTYLYEQARAIVLAHLGRSSAAETVLFCTPRRAATLTQQLDPRHVTTLSSQDVGLPLGLLLSGGLDATALAAASAMVWRRAASTSAGFSSGIMRRSSLSTTLPGTTLVLVPPLIWPMLR